VNLKALCSRFANAPARIWPVDLYSQSGFDLRNDKLETARAGIDYGGHLNLFDEFRNQDTLTMLRNTGCQANVNEQSFAKILQPFEAPVEDGASRSRYPTLPRFITFMASIAVLIRSRNSWARKPRRSFCVCSLELAMNPIAFARELRDGIGDGVIEASIERLKFIIRDQHTPSMANSVMAWHRSP
jgi:hypothetical protein